MISVSMSLIIVLSTHILVLMFQPFVILSEDCYCSHVKSTQAPRSQEWNQLLNDECFLLNFNI